MSSESLDKLHTAPKGRLVVWLVLFVIVGAVAVAATRLYELEKPQVSVLSDLSLVGRNGVIELRISDAKSGIQSFSIVLLQGKERRALVEKKFAKEGLFAGGPKKLVEQIELDALQLGMTDGRADLLIAVHDYSFWKWMAGNETIDSYALAFDVKPPRLRLIDSPVVIKPGSAGIVIYRADENIYDHGVTINDDFHPGFPVPGRSTGTFGAIIGVPYDAESINKASITAVDKAGNQGIISFAMKVRKVKKQSDRINVGGSFLDKKIPEFSQFYPEMTGSVVEQYLYVNNEIRQQNARKIKDICSHSSAEQYWSGRFSRMRRSSKRAGFAEYRTYFYNGEKIDDQVHLGVDLASVRRAEVEAANKGQVVFADYLGIYGNMVILDHGLGVFTLYSHMSEISVSVGELLEKGAVLGRTGTTGMAGGDHLHFSVLINGIFVNPLEWWDKNWLTLHISQYLKG